MAIDAIKARPTLPGDEQAAAVFRYYDNEEGSDHAFLKGCSRASVKYSKAPEEFGACLAYYGHAVSAHTERARLQTWKRCCLGA